MKCGDMRNIVTVHLPDTSQNSVLSADIASEILLMIHPLSAQKSGLKLTGTASGGTSVESDELTIENNMIQYTVPFAWYSSAGTLELRLESNEGNSDYFEFTVSADLEATDDVIVKLSSGEFVVSKHLTASAHDLLGSATAAGALNLNGNISDYAWIFIEGYFSTTNINESHLIPRSIFELGHKYYLWSNISTEREASVTYASDTSVTIADRTALNVRIYGIK